MLPCLTRQSRERSRVPLRFYNRWIARACRWFGVPPDRRDAAGKGGTAEPRIIHRTRGTACQSSNSSTPFDFDDFRCLLRGLVLSSVSYPASVRVGQQEPLRCLVFRQVKQGRQGEDFALMWLPRGNPATQSWSDATELRIVTDGES